MGPSDIAAYVGLSGDFAPLHTDAEFARRSAFGEFVLPGALITAIALGLGSIDAPLPATAAMLESRWRFLAPVRLGDTIRCRWRLNRKRDITDQRHGLAGWQVAVLNQSGSVVAEGDVVRLVARAQQPPEASAGAGETKRRRRRRGGRRGQAERVAPAELAELPEAAAEEAKVELEPLAHLALAETSGSPAPDVEAAEETAAGSSAPPEPAARARRARRGPAAAAGPEPEAGAPDAVAEVSSPAGETPAPRPRRRRSPRREALEE